MLPVLAAELDVPPAELAGAYWPPRRRHDLGGSAGEYWTAVLAALGRPPEPVLIRRLAAIDATKWSVLPPASADLLAALRATDTRLAVLSDAPAALAAAVRAAPWSRVFGTLVFSGEVGLAKPDPAVFRRADAELGPADVVFFDDTAANVDAAREHGWTAHLWTTPADALAALAA